jgi:hypothetical protein
VQSGGVLVLQRRAGERVVSDRWMGGTGRHTQSGPMRTRPSALIFTSMSLPQLLPYPHLRSRRFPNSSYAEGGTARPVGASFWWSSQRLRQSPPGSVSPSLQLHSAIPAGVQIHTAFAPCSPLAACPLLSPAAHPSSPEVLSRKEASACSEPTITTRPRTRTRASALGGAWSRSCPKGGGRQGREGHREWVRGGQRWGTSGVGELRRMGGGTRNLDPRSAYDLECPAHTSEGRACAPEEDRAARLRRSGRSDAACGVRAEEGAEEGEGAANACHACTGTMKMRAYLRMEVGECQPRGVHATTEDGSAVNELCEGLTRQERCNGCVG